MGRYGLASLGIAILAGGAVWAGETDETHLICVGVATEVRGEEKQAFPSSRLGLALLEPSDLGKMLGRETQYEFVLTAIDPVEGGTPFRDRDVNLRYQRLHSDMMTSDQQDEIVGRTKLVFDRMNGYVGLVRRLEGRGFDFDGFCRNERVRV